MNFIQSQDAIISALDCAEKLANIKGIHMANIVLEDLQPTAVINASNAFKTRLFKATINKPAVRCEYEPFEGMPIKIIMIGKQTTTFSMEAAKNAN